MTSYRLKDSATSSPGYGPDQGVNRPADRGLARLHLRPLLRPRVILPALLGLAGLLLWWNQLRGPVLPGYRIESGPLVQNVVATGRVIATSRAQVGSEITGTVRERRVKEGDTVKPGDVLVTLRSEDLVARVREAEAALRQLETVTRPQRQAELRQAEAELRQATRERERREELFARQLVADETLEQAQRAEVVARAAAERARLAAEVVAAGHTEERQLRERLAAARAQLEKTVIRAAVEGTVLTRNVEPGDLVQPGRVLLEIARSGDTEIEVPIDEKNLATLALGQQAHCLADAFPDRPFAAVVNYIAPSIDARRGTVSVRLRVNPVPAFLRQDMTVTVTVETGRRQDARVVPNDALLAADTPHPFVLVVRNGRVARQPVTLGLKGMALSEVTAGLNVGDWVLAAAANHRNLAEGARVRVSAEPLPASGSGAGSGTRRETPVRLD
ncbi:MAG TPA: efflux RND transporter periplasmic adaptor subunit [Steroidobacteraceae bacterium]|nr:efflux RND transporter periplasmic adaptor subunit [Steroidobacteraceae bacterium]